MEKEIKIMDRDGCEHRNLHRVLGNYGECRDCGVDVAISDHKLKDPAWRPNLTSYNYGDYQLPKRSEDND